MSNLKFNPRNVILLLMILVITLLRLVVTFNNDALSFANFSSIGAVALFGGTYFKNSLKAMAFPLLSLFLSDFILANTIFKPYSNGFIYEGWYWVYGAFALMVIAGRLMMSKVSVLNFVLSTLVIVLIHWIVSDIGVWYKNTMYTQDLAGFWVCLFNAIPFEFRFLGGTLAYGGVLFGGFELLKVKYPVLEIHHKKLA
jgi:hypothetical protein